MTLGFRGNDDRRYRFRLYPAGWYDRHLLGQLCLVDVELRRINS